MQDSRWKVNNSILSTLINMSKQQPCYGISGLGMSCANQSVFSYTMNTVEGFDAYFVEPLKDLWKCPICRLAAREPKLTECGHQFCTECLGPLIRGNTLSCPVCRKNLNKSQVYPNNMMKREILGLKIECYQCKKGCIWQGELRQREQHNKQCGYVQEACSNDCGESLMRKDMDNHRRQECSRRIVVCSYCGTYREYRRLGGHYVTCDGYPVDCPYKCGMQIARKDVELHTSEEDACSNKPLTCEFAFAGCQFIGNKRHLKDHMQTSTVDHLSLAMKSVAYLGKRLAETEDELANVKEKQAQTDSRLVVAEENLAATDLQLAEAKTKQTKTDFLLAEAEKKQTKTDFQLAEAEKKQEVAEKEYEQTKAQLATTEANFREVKEALDLELKLSKPYKRFMKRGWKESLESAEFVRAVLDMKTEISLAIDGTTVYLWKIDSKGLVNSQGYSSLRFFRAKPSILSTEFYTGYSGLRLQLEFGIIPNGSNYSFKAMVYILDRPLRLKCFMSVVLHDQRDHQSEIRKTIDLAALVCQKGRYVVELEFQNTSCFDVTDGLLMVFQLK